MNYNQLNCLRENDLSEGIAFLDNIAKGMNKVRRSAKKARIASAAVDPRKVPYRTPEVAKRDIVKRAVDTGNRAVTAVKREQHMPSKVYRGHAKRRPRTPIAVEHKRIVTEQVGNVKAKVKQEVNRVKDKVTARMVRPTKLAGAVTLGAGSLYAIAKAARHFRRAKPALAAAIPKLAKVKAQVRAAQMSRRSKIALASASSGGLTYMAARRAKNKRRNK